MTIKILNLYAGIGGNRKLWNGDIEVTAIENEPKIAEIYKKFFPKDRVLIEDAHQFLLEHYQEYDFIWSSPPCPSHSRIRKLQGDLKNYKPLYPDMKLYEEIILLQNYFKGKFVVENVKPYYEPLIKPQVIDRHCFWTNFNIEQIRIKKDFIIRIGGVSELEKAKGVSIQGYNLGCIDKRQILRNMVNSELGLHIFEMAFKKPQRTLI